MNHKIVKYWKDMHSGDCYLYQNKCNCGKVSGGWTSEEADKEASKHIEEQNEKKKN